ncbi:unnamed protein product [Camellia sinensis]
MECSTSSISTADLLRRSPPPSSSVDILLRRPHQLRSIGSGTFRGRGNPIPVGDGDGDCDRFPVGDRGRGRGSFGHRGSGTGRVVPGPAPPRPVAIPICKSGFSHCEDVKYVGTSKGIVFLELANIVSSKFL